MGVSRALRAARPGVRVTLVEPAESPFLSAGAKGSHRVEGIGIGIRPPLLDDRLYDRVLAVPEEEGRRMARRLAAEEGLLAGTSTGLNLAAAALVAKERGPDETVVTIAVDSGLKYLAGDLYLARA
jgi:cysteine synthase